MRESEKGRSKESCAEVRRIREKGVRRKEVRKGRRGRAEDNTWTSALKYFDTSVYC